MPRSRVPERIKAEEHDKREEGQAGQQAGARYGMEDASGRESAAVKVKQRKSKDVRRRVLRYARMSAQHAMPGRWHACSRRARARAAACARAARCVRCSARGALCARVCAQLLQGSQQRQRGVCACARAQQEKAHMSLLCARNMLRHGGVCAVRGGGR